MKRQCTTWLAAVGAVLCLFWAGCEDKGTEPVPLQDYVAYFADRNRPEEIYGYHTASGDLDTFSVPVQPEQMTLASDGKSLLLGLSDSSVVLDASTMDVVIALPYAARGGIAVSPEGQYVALQDDDLYIVRTADYSVAIHDTDEVRRGKFSANGTNFYAIGGASSYVYKAGIEEQLPPIRKSFSNRWVIDVCPSPDEAKWYLYVAFDLCGMTFHVYNVAGDSVIFEHFFQPGHGELELSPNGRWLYFTYPDQTITYCVPPESSFSVVDLSRPRVFPIGVTIEAFPWGADLVYFADLEISPDGFFAVGIEVHRGVLVTLITDRFRTHHFHYFGYQSDLFGLTMQ